MATTAKMIGDVEYDIRELRNTLADQAINIISNNDDGAKQASDLLLRICEDLAVYRHLVATFRVEVAKRQA